MVLEEHTELELEPEEVRPAVPYFVDEKWYDEHGLSYHDIVQARMCEACQSRAAAGEVAEEHPCCWRTAHRYRCWRRVANRWV